MTPSLCSGTAVTYLVNPPLLKSLWKAAEETNEEGGGFFSSSSACDMLVPIWGDMICDYMIGFEGLWPGYFFWYGGPALVDDAEQGLQCIYENLKTTVVCIRILSLRIFHNFGSWPNGNPNALRFAGEASHTEMPPHPRMSCPHKMKNPVHRTRLLEMVWVSGKWREFRPPPAVPFRRFTTSPAAWAPLINCHQLREQHRYNEISLLPTKYYQLFFWTKESEISIQSTFQIIYPKDNLINEYQYSKDKNQYYKTISY